MQSLQSASLEASAPVPKMLINWWQWYQKLIGLDIVEVAKQSVIDIQKTLFKCQEERRDLSRLAASKNQRLKEIYSELLHIRRDDPKYVELTIQENRTLQEQLKINEELSFIEKEERDYFTQLATAIKEYHDAQNMNAQNYKYLSIVASISVALVSLLGTIVYNNKRIADMNRSISDAQIKNENMFKMYFEMLESKLRVDFTAVSRQIEQTNKSFSWIAKDPAMIKYAQHVMSSNAAEDEHPATSFDIEKAKHYSFYAALAIVSLVLLSKIS